MSSDPDFEKRINNKIETILETQANLQEAIAGLIQVARLHDGQLDHIREQMEENSRQIAALVDQGKSTREDLSALIRIVEGHLTGHP